MPLFMDLHKASDYETKPTVDEIKRSHIADLAVQHKYGVKFLQYWINEEAGMVFCLMEAPDKESCAAVHQEAHGNMPCNIIELQGGDYSAFTGTQTTKNEFDIVENAEGQLDTGYRTIAAVDILSLTNNDALGEIVDTVANRYNGHFLNRPSDRKTIVFMPGKEALDCALNMLQHVHSLPGKNEIRIGISAGEPVTHQQHIFADAIQLANRMCDIAQNNEIVISSTAKELIGETKLQSHNGLIKILDQEDEQFLSLLADTITTTLPDTSFNIDGLSKRLGMSRSALYRKTKDLAGCSTNSLIHELRMQKAVQLLKKKYGNITQVAMEAGFSNLSYFAKSFQKRFGMPPLKAAKIYG